MKPGGIFYEKESSLEVPTAALVGSDGTDHRSVGDFALGGAISANGKIFGLVADVQDGQPDDDSEGAPDDPGVISTDGKHHQRIWHVGDTVGSVVPNPTGVEAVLTLATNADRSGNIIKPNEAAGIWVVNIHSGARHYLGAGEGPITWSPDGRRVAFFRSDPLTMVNGTARLVTEPVTGGAVTTVATFRAGTIGDNFNLSWSPDGTTIMLGGDTPNGSNEVETFPADGGPRNVLVTNNSNTRICSAAWSPTGA